MSDATRDARFGRPVVWVLAAIALFPAVLVVSRLIGRFAALGTTPREFLGEALLLAGTLAIVALSGWWRQSGLTAIWQSQGWVLILAGLLFLEYLLTTPVLIAHAKWSILAQALLLVALVGFNEESLMRGVVLHGLSPRGPLFAGLVSAAIFGLLHLGNLLSIHQPSAVALQAFNAANLGLLFAALRLRMASLWPVIAAHALWDLPGILLGYPMANPPPVGALGLTVDLVLILPIGGLGLGLLIHQAVRRRRRQALAEGRVLSGDGHWWWNGTQWISTRSADGRWRWDGATWLPVPDDITPASPRGRG